MRLFNKKYAARHPYQSATTSFVTILAVFGLAGWFLFTNFSSSASAWWNDDWHYRKQLTINSSEVDADLTNFPMLVSITDGDLASKAQTDGDDIVFTLNPGNKLDHEIESFDNTTGELVAWVKIPELDSDDDSSIYMYYGNPTTDNQQKATEVWDENFVMVQHMDSNTSILDSTKYDNDGIAYDSPVETDDGKINGGLEFSAGTDRIEIDTKEITHNMQTKTIEAWLQVPDQGAAGVILGKVDSSDEDPGWRLRLRSDEQVAYRHRFSGGFAWWEYDTSLTIGDWYHVAVSYDYTAASPAIYINGSSVTVYEAAAKSGDHSDDSSQPLIIGNEDDGNSDFEGTMGEVRVSNSLRSATWISTEFNNQDSPSTFLSISAEEQGPGPVLYLPFDEGFGTTAHDESSAHNDATISGASWATEDMCKTGKCLQFDGDDYLEIDDDNTLDLTNEMTMEAWVKPTSTNKTNQTIISKQEKPDEPTKIFRSVGPSATTAITTGSSNEMTIAGDTATFASSLPTNVGVGDAIQYDDDSDGDIDTDDSLAFITGRISNTQYTITNAAGGTPTEVSSDTDWSLFRAYTSLANWEAGTENTGIDADLRAFDAGNRDIATAGEQWNVACYANGTTADGTNVDIDGWTTSADNYIEIYTPTEFDEVGVTQRHSGAWDDNKYKFEPSGGGDGIDIAEDFVRINGIQLKHAAADRSNNYSVNLSPNSVAPGAEVHINNSIIIGEWTGTSSNCHAIQARYHDTDDSNRTLKVWNNVIYGYENGAYTNMYTVNVFSGWSAVVYNNTIKDSYNGIRISPTRATGYVENNMMQDCTVGFEYNPDYASHNITEQDALDGAFGSTHSTGTTDSTTASKLVDSGATFLTDGVQVGSIVSDGTNYSYVTALDSETTLSVNDDIFTSGESYSVYTNKYGSVTFENEGSDDFRLDQTDTLAINQGVDLSADSNLAFTTDIEGQTRIDTNSMTNEHEYDIGADEYVPTKIYRSVGPGSTDALEEGTDNPMTIVGDTATFTEGLADNIGVGDAIQYDDDDDGDIDSNDSIAFVSKRFSNYKFQITNSSGGLPTEVTSDTDWSLYRAYTSLSNAESGDENDGIDDDLEAFESWVDGKDITTSGEQWNIACYGNGTTADSNVLINGWTTSANNNIKVYTPVYTWEVGESQRHEGVWDDNKYHSETPGTDWGGGIRNYENYVSIEGLQAYVTYADAGQMAGIQIDYVSTWDSDVRVSDNIIKRETGTYTNNWAGIYQYQGIMSVWNNIIYDFDSTNNIGINADRHGAGEASIYNNTIQNSTMGIMNTGGTVVVKNNLIKGATTDYSGTFDSSSTHNVANVTPGSASAFGATQSAGTTDGTTASKLVDSSATFVTDGVQVGSIVVDTSNTQYTYVTAIDSETTLSVNDDYFILGENYSVYTNIYGAVTFVDEAGDNFHLDTIDTVALAQGADLSSDPNLPLTTDIDGDKREGNFSIGADEGTPTKIYRSVGPSNTTALATGADNDMTISGSTATFDEPLPDRVGVGDAIQYDDDSDGDIDVNDSIVFISGRTSSTEYTVKTTAGVAPTAVTDDNNWSIFRAYTSLALAETGTENTGIDSDLVNFDTFSGGKDLTISGEQWNIACYGDAPDTGLVTINSWTTSEDNFIKVYTPVVASEVGVRQRHNGKWNAEKYHMNCIQTSNDTAPLFINDDNVIVEGLQVLGSNTTIQGGFAVWTYGATNVAIKSNIFRADVNSTGNTSGVAFEPSDILTDVVGYAENNILYDHSSNGLFSYAGSGRTSEVYASNNTIFDVGTGYAFSGVGTITYHAKNNIAQDCTDGFSGSFASDSDFNISDVASDNTGGAHDKDSTTVTFRDEANDDFRLAMSDTSAKAAGLNLYNDSTLPITTDITGEARPSPQDTITKKQDTNGGMTPGFDIGADQISGIDHDNYSMSLYNDAARITSSDEVFGTYQDDIPANRWSHISYTRDSTNQYLYINGTERQTDTIDNFLFDNNGKLYIGSKDNSSNNSFQGFIDEIRIYPYARTAGEIRADRAAASSGRAVSRANEGLAASFGGGGDNFMSDGLVAYYKMDETTGTTYTDSSGNNNHGTLTNAQETGTAEIASTTTTVVDADNTDLSTTDDAYNGMLVEITGGTCGISVGTTQTISDYTGATRTITVPTAFSAETDACTFLIDHQVGGKFGSGVDFDGTGGYAITTNVINIEGNFTVSAWAYADDDVEWNELPIISTQTMDDYNGFSMSYRDFGDVDRLYARVGYAHSADYANIDNNGCYQQWCHYLYTYKTDGSLEIYLNGALMEVAEGLADVSASKRILIGGGINYESGGGFIGNIDEVRIYNRALGAREVKELYEWAPGPVMHLKMDEKVAGDAQTLYDTSGNENNGTTVDGANDSGMDCTALGKYGSACEFDGVDDYVNAGNFDFASGDYSLSAWIKTTQNSTGSVLARTGTSFVGGDSGVRFNLQAGGTMELEISDGSSIGYVNLSNNANDGQWHHVAAVKKGTEAFVYIDQEMESDTGMPSGDCDYNNIMAIGRGGHSDIWDFDGMIDDVKIYNYARTQDQIIEDMNAGHPAGGSPVGSPVAYWKFDTGYGDTAYDELGNNNGTLDASTGGTNTDESEMWSLDGKQGKAMEFDGTDDYVDLGSSAGTTIEDEITISSWVKADSDTFGRIAAKHGSSGNFGWILARHNTDDTFEWRISTTGSDWIGGDTSNDSFEVDTWYHVVSTYDGSNMRVYIDGQEDTSGDFPVAQTGDINISTVDMGIGATGVPDYFFNGMVDEVKIYSYAMTDAQVKTEFNMGKAQVMGQDPSRDNNGTAVSGAAAEYCIPGDTAQCDVPVLELKMDEMSGTTAYDTSGNGNDGTLTGGPTWTGLGKVGSALSFDGSTNYVTLPNSSDLQVSTNYTVSAWAKISGDTADAFHREAVISRYFGWDRVRYDYDQAQWEFDIATDGTDPAGIVKSDSSVNTWRHLSYSYDGSNFEAYFNGALVDSNVATGNSTYFDEPWQVGANGNNLWVMNGLIDDVKIYDYARTPAQIAWDYSGGEPVGWWKMDEASGTQVPDWSGNENHGTMTNMDPGTDRVAGKFNNALDFDGSDDYVAINSFTSFSTDSGTASAWIKRDFADDTTVYHTAFSVGNNGDEFIDFYYGTGGDLFTLDYQVGASYDRIQFAASEIPQNVWAYITYTWDKTADELKLYLNGSQKGTTQSTLATFTDVIDEASIGRGTYGTGSNTYWDGVIEDVQIWNYALTEVQIKEAMNQGAVSFQ